MKLTLTTQETRFEPKMWDKSGTCRAFLTLHVPPGICETQTPGNYMTIIPRSFACF